MSILQFMLQSYQTGFTAFWRHFVLTVGFGIFGALLLHLSRHAVLVLLEVPLGQSLSSLQQVKMVTLVMAFVVVDIFYAICLLPLLILAATYITKSNAARQQQGLLGFMLTNYVRVLLPGAGFVVLLQLGLIAIIPGLCVLLAALLLLNPVAWIEKTTSVFSFGRPESIPHLLLTHGPLIVLFVIATQVVGFLTLYIQASVYYWLLGLSFGFVWTLLHWWWSVALCQSMRFSLAMAHPKLPANSSSTER